MYLNWCKLCINAVNIVIIRPGAVLINEGCAFKCHEASAGNPSAKVQWQLDQVYQQHSRTISSNNSNNQRWLLAEVG